MDAGNQFRAPGVGKIKKQTANKANKPQARASQMGTNTGSRQIKPNQIKSRPRQIK
jgi:hypothetical protein